MKKSLTLLLSRRRLFSTPVKPSAGLQIKIPQAPNHPSTWSSRQMPRVEAMTGPRFETVSLDKQPAPAAAIELISAVPINRVKERIIACDGGGGPLGHPKIYINLDQGKPISCTYCGLRFQLTEDH